jgi:hypothetical protein
MNSLVSMQGLMEKLTQRIYLDRVLQILGIAGFIVTYLNAWRSMGFELKLGFVFSAAAWFVGTRFTKIYR